jgi:hypothetical protein
MKTFTRTHYSLALTNGIKISNLLDVECDLTPKIIEEIESAALALAVIEAAPDFEWGVEFEDWKTVCLRCAEVIAKGKPVKWTESIRDILR